MAIASAYRNGGICQRIMAAAKWRNAARGGSSASQRRKLLAAKHGNRQRLAAGVSACVAAWREKPRKWR